MITACAYHKTDEEACCAGKGRQAGAASCQPTLGLHGRRIASSQTGSSWQRLAAREMGAGMRRSAHYRKPPWVCATGPNGNDLDRPSQAQ